MNHVKLYLLAILIAAVPCLGHKCGPPPPPPPPPPPDTLSIFEFEYDWMDGWDAFTTGSEHWVTEAFRDAKTHLWIVESNELDYVVYNFSQLDSLVRSWGDTLNDGTWDRTCYLVSLGNVEGLEPEDLMGLATWKGVEGRATVYIFLQNIKRLYPNESRMVPRVIIHELGHARANLTHLCEDPANHDADDCIMAEEEIHPYCSPEWVNVLDNLHFCDKCCNKIYRVKW